MRRNADPRLFRISELVVESRASLVLLTIREIVPLHTISIAFIHVFFGSTCNIIIVCLGSMYVAQTIIVVSGFCL